MTRERSFSIAVTLGFLLLLCASTLAAIGASSDSSSHATWKDIKQTVVPVGDGFLLIDWNKKTAMHVPSSVVRRQNKVYQLKADTVANCVALVSDGKSFTGEQLVAE